MKQRARVLSALCLCLIGAAVHASITRTDVLECGFPDGSKFVLRSNYEWSTIPWPAPHHSRRSKQQAWSAQYHDVLGKAVGEPTSTPYAAAILEASRNTCLRFGKLSGRPIVAASYLQPNGQWWPSSSLPWDRLHIAGLHHERPIQLRAELERLGLLGTVFVLIFPGGHGLVYEQALTRESRGDYHGLPIEGVYQSFSIDEGKTWSDPVITTQGQIFEIGKSWADQCFVAKPIKINGERIAADFTPCSPKPPMAAAPASQPKPDRATNKL